MPRGRRPRSGPDPIDVAVGANLRRLRRMRGLSQAQLGNQLDLTFQQIQKYEKGTSRVAVSTLVRMARVLEVTASALIEGLNDIEEAGSPLAWSKPRLDSEVAHSYRTIPHPEVRQSLRLYLRALADAAL